MFTSWFLSRRPQLSGKKEIILIFIPALIWGMVSISRPYVLEAHCHQDESKCKIEELHKYDQPVVFFQNHEKDARSFITQNMAGGVSLALPVLYWGSKWAFSSLHPGILVFSLGTDLILLGQTILWNGALMEFSRVFFQRPRPFVYRDIEVAGANPSHYTSFYSGHTSFVAAVSMISFLLLLTYGIQKKIWFFLFATYGVVITFLTGLYRVLNGRHFVSDVCVAAFMGFLVAMVIFRLHSSEKK